MNFVQYHGHPPYAGYLQAWQERTLKWQYILAGKIKKDWDDFIFLRRNCLSCLVFVIAGSEGTDRVYLNASFNNFGCLALATIEPLSDEHFDILV